MKSRLMKVMMVLSMVVSMFVPQIQNALAAGTEAYEVVDDTATNPSDDHYFTYSEATSEDGLTGWVADTKKTIIDQDHTTASQTQHWVWNEDYNEAKKHTYTFTFKGTGVELIGVKNDAQNTFKMDSEEAVTLTIEGAANQTTKLYSRKNLTYGTHTVSVTLPEGGTGLQVCYAKVYGAVEETTRIPFTQITGDSNKFIYSPTGWSAMGGSDEHVWSDAPGASPSDIYYEVKFVGHKIDVYAGKNHPMGMVEYFVDGVSKGKFSLYNSSNINSTFITTIDGLTEEEYNYIFKENIPVIFVFHGYPNLIESLTSTRTKHFDRVLGYIEEGSITTPFDMRVQNGIDRFNICLEALKYIPNTFDKFELTNYCIKELIKHKEYIREYGKDLPEIDNWKWTN